MKSFNEFLERFYESYWELVDWERVALWNAYQQAISSDDEIFDNDEEFFELFFSGKTPYEIAQCIEGTNWTSYHDYVKFDAYGNVKSVYNLDTEIHLSEMAEYAYENKDFIYEIESFMDVDELVNFFD